MTNRSENCGKPLLAIPSWMAGKETQRWLQELTLAKAHTSSVAARETRVASAFQTLHESFSSIEGMLPIEV